jgi:hypothetical protein
MSDLNRVVQMLESASAAERRKAVDVLARSSSSKAYDLIKAAYEKETNAELRTLMVDAGQQIKRRQTQTAPASSTSTPKPTRRSQTASSTSTMRVVKPETPSSKLDLPAYQAYEEMGSTDNTEKEKKKKNAPATSIISPKVIQLFMALIVAGCGFGITMSISQPWVNLAGLPYQGGTFGAYIEQVKNGIRDMPNTINIRQAVHVEHVGRVDAGFGSLDIADILSGERSGWGAIFTPDYLQAMAEQHTGRVFQDVYADANSQSLDGALFLSSIIGIVICILGFNIVWRLIFGFGNFAMFGLLGLLLQALGMRATWIVALVMGCISLGMSLYFYLSMLPRFVPAALTSLGIGTESINYMSLLGTGFIINTFAALVVMIVSGFVLMEDSISTGEAA